jgi:hypothetical protein
MAFARRRERALGRPQPAGRAGGVAGAAREAGAVEALCHALDLGLFVRNEINPE